MEDYRWWQRGIIYQVYPRSFQDSNGDGIGDLPGILTRLDYLEWLGITAIWLSPIFPSPMVDFGYDIEDYTGIDPLFGTMADFDTLLEAVHRRGIKLILDLVPNHTSSQHPWFRESRASRDNLKRDWYLWHDPAPNGGPPNNWLSVFGGSAWEWDERTGQYYFHAFHKEQPDLNWRNPEVERAMMEVMRSWLEKGIDGFRVDVMWHLIKDALYRDNPPNPDWQEGELPYKTLLATFSTDQPETHTIVARMRRLLERYPDRLLIGEIYLPVTELIAYYGRQEREAHLPYNFQLIRLPWDARRIASAIAAYEGQLPPFAWPNWVLGNHDRRRIASRVGTAQARVAAVLLLTLRGTPTMYYGDELGMQDVDIPPAMQVDPQGHGTGISRDPVRTPMQWDDGPHAGFSEAVPWLPLAGDYREKNVELERREPGSVLCLYRRLIQLRQAEPALHVGTYLPVLGPEDVLAFVRQDGDTRFLVALNLKDTPARLEPEQPEVRGQVEVGTHLEREGERVEGAITLRGDEGVVVRLS